MAASISNSFRILLIVAFAMAGTLSLCPCPSIDAADTVATDTCCPLSETASGSTPEIPAPDEPHDCTHCQSLTFTAPNAGPDVATVLASPPPSFPLPVAASATLTWNADPAAPRTRGGPAPPDLRDRTSLHAQRILLLI